VSATEADDGVVLLDERAGTYWQLNDSGAQVLRTLLSGGGAREAAEALCADYPVAAERAAADVRALVERLIAAGLVESAGARR
jgi:hypothetical protein